MLQTFRHSHQSAVCLVETPTDGHTAAGWGQCRHNCCHGYPQLPSTGSDTLVSVVTGTEGEKEV